MQVFQRAYLIITTLVVFLSPVLSQDTVFIRNGFSETRVQPEQIGFLQEKPGTFQLSDLRNLHFSSDTGDIHLSDTGAGFRGFCRLMVRNISDNPVDISVSRTIPDSANVYIYNDVGRIIKCDRLNHPGTQAFRKDSDPTRGLCATYTLIFSLTTIHVFPKARDLQFRFSIIIISFNRNCRTDSSMPCSSASFSSAPFST